MIQSCSEKLWWFKVPYCFTMVTMIMFCLSSNYRNQWCRNMWCPACLFYRVCNMFLKELTSFLAALLFAVHPIHTEAVSFNILNRFIESVWNIFNFFVKSLEKKKWYCKLLKYIVVKYNFFNILSFCINIYHHVIPM